MHTCGSRNALNSLDKNLHPTSDKSHLKVQKNRFCKSNQCIKVSDKSHVMR